MNHQDGFEDVTLRKNKRLEEGDLLRKHNQINNP